MGRQARPVDAARSRQQYSPMRMNIGVAPPGLDDTLIALADPTRRKLLERLAAGEARVTDLAAPFSIALNSVSKHLRMLERAGLVRRRVRGREHFLSLVDDPLAHAAAWIDAQRAAWSAQLRTLDAVARTSSTAASTSRSSGRRA